MRILLLFTIFLLPLQIEAQDIYTWTDEQGRVHYGSRPPISAEVELVEKGQDRPLLESVQPRQELRSATVKHIQGHFIGNRLGQTVHLVFFANGNFVESLEYQEKGRAKKNMRSYAGTWTLYQKHLKFSLSFTDHGSNFISPPITAKVLGVENGNIHLAWEDVKTIFVKQFRKSHVAFPRHLR